MPLQNRVTPQGDIVAVPERGLYTGNRGILHDPASRTLRRRWVGRRWIMCLCDFRGRRRVVMSPNTWTELFFLDEATGLAAGHRPCFYCRRADAQAFQAAWAAGHGGAPPDADTMDSVLHAERLDGRAKRLHPLPGPLATLPDGAMVAAGPDSFLVCAGALRRWTPGGYTCATMPGSLMLLTPPSSLRALAQGYRPVLHPSAKGPS